MAGKGKFQSVTRQQAKKAGEYLRALRLAKAKELPDQDWTLEAVASRRRISKVYLYQAERGYRGRLPSVGLLKTLAEEYGIPISTLLVSAGHLTNEEAEIADYTTAERTLLDDLRQLSDTSPERHHSAVLTFVTGEAWEGVPEAKMNARRLGVYLRWVRQQHGLSLVEVYGRSRVSAAFLSQVERGVAGVPPIETLRVLVQKAYKVPLSRLLWEADVLSPEHPESLRLAPSERTFLSRVRQMPEEGRERVSQMIHAYISAHWAQKQL